MCSPHLYNIHILSHFDVRAVSLACSLAYRYHTHTHTSIRRSSIYGQTATDQCTALNFQIPMLHAQTHAYKRTTVTSGEYRIRMKKEKGKKTERKSNVCVEKRKSNVMWIFTVMYVLYSNAWMVCVWNDVFL